MAEPTLPPEPPESHAWRKLQDLFDHALELPSEDRESFLSQIPDAELVAEVRSLLRAHEESSGFLASPPALSFERNAEPGDRIGRYRIEEEIGRGGMGVVYRATREEDGFVQQVAIKLIDAGMLSQEVLKRFRAERQILALLDHPNIARLIDGGSTTDGRPFLVMEHVSGSPLLASCDERRLGIAERLATFLTVCDAVQFAHQRLVVHRDLKPENILVTADGSPRLLDFGIAKLLSPEGVAAGTLTLPVNRMLTPDYASPEQIRGEPATVAGDVYSLGVILYELLSGSRPHRFSTRSPEEILRVVAHEEPLLPSTVAARSPEAAERRADTTSRLRRRLAGDLDYVILKALEIDPKRRYGSVDQLAQDLRRHLAGMPVLARGRSTTYLVSRFVRRHRAAVVTVGLVVTALVAGLFGTTWQANVARHERDLARRRFEDVRNLAHAVVFDIHDAIANLPGSTKARETLVLHALRYLDGLSHEAKGDVSLQKELAGAYMKIGDVQGRPMYPNLGQTTAALKSYDQSLALLREVARAEPESTSVTHNLFVVAQRRSDLLNIMGKKQEALDEAYRIKAEIQSRLAHAPGERIFQEDLCVTYGRIVNLEHEQFQDTLAAVRECTQYLALVSSLFHGNPGNPGYRRGTLIASTKMAQLRALMGDRDSALVFYERAESLAREAVASRKNDTDAIRDLSIVYGEHGLFLAGGGDVDSGIAVHGRGMAISEQLAAADPQNVVVVADVAAGHYEIGTMLMEGRRYAAAVPRFQEAFERYRRLAEADTTNAESRQCMARSSRGAGEACLALSRSKRPASERNQWRTRGVTWLTQSRDLFLELTRTGEIEGDDTKAPAEIDKLLADSR
ncbi:MAG TPA: serine/threonine-protein kinase [Candidatus Eisenbacteria bacterium]|nr:serine/threonine-protein kinase [Candidatus Eisenbacteria bacterium]